MKPSKASLIETYRASILVQEARGDMNMANVTRGMIKRLQSEIEAEKGRANNGRF